MSTTTEKKRVPESSSTNVHHVDVDSIRGHVHRHDHAWINIGRTAFHFDSEADLIVFAEKILAAVVNPDRD